MLSGNFEVLSQAPFDPELLDGVAKDFFLIMKDEDGIAALNGDEHFRDGIRRMAAEAVASSTLARLACDSDFDRDLPMLISDAPSDYMAEVRIGLFDLMSDLERTAPIQPPNFPAVQLFDARLAQIRSLLQERRSK